MCGVAASMSPLNFSFKTCRTTSHYSEPCMIVHVAAGKKWCMRSKESEAWQKTDPLQNLAEGWVRADVGTTDRTDTGIEVVASQPQCIS